MKLKHKTTNGFATITSQDKFDSEIKINPHASPIFTSSTYVYESAEKAQAVFQ